MNETISSDTWTIGLAISYIVGESGERVNKPYSKGARWMNASVYMHSAPVVRALGH